MEAFVRRTRGDVRRRGVRKRVSLSTEHPDLAVHQRHVHVVLVHLSRPVGSYSFGRVSQCLRFMSVAFCQCLLHNFVIGERLRMGGSCGFEVASLLAQSAVSASAFDSEAGSVQCLQCVAETAFRVPLHVRHRCNEGSLRGEIEGAHHPLGTRDNEKSVEVAFEACVTPSADILGDWGAGSVDDGISGAVMDNRGASVPSVPLSMCIPTTELFGQVPGPQ